MRTYIVKTDLKYFGMVVLLMIAGLIWKSRYMQSDIRAIPLTTDEQAVSDIMAMTTTSAVQVIADNMPMTTTATEQTITGKGDMFYPSIIHLNELRKNEGIYFIEASHDKKKFPFFNYCSFESTAKQNPERPIYILINKENREMTIDSYLNEYPNLKFSRFDLYDAFNHTILKHSFTRSDFDLMPTHDLSMSNIGRFVILFLKGGAYLDFDFLSIKPFPSYCNNRLVKVSKGGFMLALSSFEAGHPFLEMVMGEMHKRKGRKGFGNFSHRMYSHIFKNNCTHGEVFKCAGGLEIPKGDRCNLGLEKFQNIDKINSGISPEKFIIHCGKLSNSMFDNKEELAKFKGLFNAMVKLCPKTAEFAGISKKESN